MLDSVLLPNRTEEETSASTTTTTGSGKGYGLCSASYTYTTPATAIAHFTGVSVQWYLARAWNSNAFMAGTTPRANYAPGQANTNRTLD